MGHEYIFYISGKANYKTYRTHGDIRSYINYLSNLRNFILLESLAFWDNSCGSKMMSACLFEEKA